jgi:hypothetical protein
VPPLVGVAVNVTLVPEQMVDEGEAAMLTPAATDGFTTIVIVFDVAGLPVAHVFDDVITHTIVFPFVNAASVYVALLVPTFTPFFFH